MHYQRSSLELSSEKRERTYIGLSLGILGGLIAFIILCWAGHRYYVRWQEKRLVVRAEAALRNGDLRMANLATGTVLQMNPNSIGGARMAAQLGEKTGDRTAIQWRRKVVQQLPNSVDDILNWARAALQFNDPAEAQRAIDRVPPNGRNNAGFHAVAAVIAQQRHHEEEAAHEWAEAVQLAPEEKTFLLQHGLFELRSANPALRDQGKATLTRLRRDRQFRLAATRALVHDGIEHHENGQDLLILAREMKDYPEAEIKDRLLYLDFLHQINDPGFAAYLTELEQFVNDRPADLSALLAWLSRSSLNLVAQDFAKTLSAAQLQAWPVPAALADVEVRLKDWRQLETFLKKADWRERDLFRHAYLARALRGLDQPASSAREWAAAVAGAGQNAETTFQLFQLANDWGWIPEALDLQWALSKYPDRERDALATLYRHYLQQQDAEGIFRVLTRLSEIDPDNLDIKNNLAQIGLLFETKPEEARRIAADNYRQQPANAAYATTYAYSLLSEGSKDKALAVMKKLTPEQLEDPSIAAYYGICLAAVKDPAAATYLTRAEKAPLLPPEKALVQKAWNSLR
jgi:thioredoxin-like negative regulator of GroEL